MCLYKDDLAQDNDDAHIFDSKHGHSVASNHHGHSDHDPSHHGCNDVIHLTTQGEQKRIWGTSHFALTLSHEVGFKVISKTLKY